HAGSDSFPTRRSSYLIVHAHHMACREQVLPPGPFSKASERRPGFGAKDLGQVAHRQLRDGNRPPEGSSHRTADGAPPDQDLWPRSEEHTSELQSREKL